MLLHGLCVNGSTDGMHDHFIFTFLKSVEASFTFATSAVISFVAVERDWKSGHTLFYTITPKQGVAGNCQTAPLPRSQR
jgi:hypothetical protein